MASKRMHSEDSYNLVNIVALHLVGSFVYSDLYEVKHKSEEGNDIIEMCKQYMHDSIHESFTLEEMASNVGYSVSYLQRTFVLETGVSPMQYFTKIKVERAKEYLKRTDLSIQMIAMKLGFKDPLYFSRLFKKHTGDTPSAYRLHNHM